MIVSVDEMRRLEEAALTRGATAEELMEEVGRRMAETVAMFAPGRGRVCVAFVGRGHNGGDALVAARHLRASAGWSVLVRLSHAPSDLAPLTRCQLERLAECDPIAGPERGPALFDGLDAVLGAARLAGRVLPPVVLDGLLGLGAKPPLRGPVSALCGEVNRLRRERAAVVFALDLPSGIDGDTGALDPGAVCADHTLAVGHVKRGSLADGATGHVGRLSVIGVERLGSGAGAGDRLATGADLASLVPPRSYDVHKGDFGRVSVVAGSVGYAGAAILVATGALRAGAGLVTLHVPRDLYSVAAPMAPPEIMVRPVSGLPDAAGVPADAAVVGPGLGRAACVEARALVRSWAVPMVVDADALNALADDLDPLSAPAALRLLTPHPGEMRRLIDWGNDSRAEVARRFVACHPVTLLLKGARTVVAERGRPLSYNPTGGPGMATGGMGDVLAGVCGALLARGLGAWDAGALGAWLCGRAAECAIAASASQESLVASGVLGALGCAFDDLRLGVG